VDRDRVALTRRLAWIAAGIAPVAFFALFFAYPIGSLIGRGLRGDGTSVRTVLADPALRHVIWFTFWQAALSTVLTLAAGLPAAWALARFDFPGRRVARAVLVVPFVLPTLVVGAALRAVFDRLGLDHGGLHLQGTVWAILLAHVIFNVAVVVRVVGGYWALLDPRAEEAARVLGATRRRTFREVTVPRLAPALWSAAAIVFLFCFTSFGVILTVGAPGHVTLETEIWRYATQRTDFATAAVLSVIQLAAVVGLLVTSTRLERRASVRARAGRATTARHARTRRQRLSLVTVLGASSLLVVLPLGMLLERSLKVGEGHGLANYRALAHSDTRRAALFVPPLEAVGNSVVYAVTAMLIAVTVGGIVSVIIVYGRAWIGRVFDIGLMIPLGTSAVTLGFGILIALDEPPLDLRASRLIVPIAQALVGTPFVMRSLVPTLRAIDPRLRDAATMLGAPPRRVRREIDLAVAWRALLVGAAFSFAISLGEFGATSFLARPDAPPVPIARFRLLGQPGAALRGQAMALGVVLAALTAATVLLIERVRPRDSLGW
jgi:thiamine transport system permease protein